MVGDGDENGPVDGGPVDGSEAPTLHTPARRVAEAEELAAMEEWTGRYTHEREQARGGIGRVLVVHDEHIGREIALKELLDDAVSEVENGESPLPASTPQSARFLREARLTGQLEHPSIVPVHELGRRQDGTLYYTMKLVRGQTLARAVRVASSRAERLELLPHFVDLCQAVAYAHSRGVIHRDIKPANVMVGEFGETVVIDWGLAKVHGQEDIHEEQLHESRRSFHLGTDQDLGQTSYGEAIGTPIYMPPEQARGDLDRVDERSDVYSLGAVLYELLTGSPPFSGGDSVDVLNRVVSKQPPRVVEVAPGSPPELEAICRKAMAKDPEQRYSSAKDLADEVGSFLAGGLVHAYSYSFAEHLGRFVRRHKVPVVVASLAVVLLTAVLSVATVWNHRERRRAEREAATATRVSEFLTSIFEVSDPGESRGSKVTAREILDRGAARIETELAEEPLIQARLLSTIGWVYLNLGLLDQAEGSLQRALNLRSAGLPADHPEVAANLYELSAVYLDQGRLEEAEDLARRAIALFEVLLEPDHSQLNTTRTHLASIELEYGNYGQAQALYQQALASQERSLGPDHPDIAHDLNNLANAFSYQGLYDQAVPLLERAAAIQENTLGADHPDYAGTLNNLAMVYRQQGRAEEAEPLFVQVLELREKALGPEHHLFAGSLDNLATVYVDLGRFEEAEPLYRRAVAIRGRALGPDHPELGNSLNNLANLFLQQGRVREAEPLFRQALTIWEAAFGADHPNVGIALNNLGAVLAEQGHFQEAEALLTRALVVLEAALGDDHPILAEVLDEYAKLLRATGRDQAAQESEERAATIRGPQSGG